MVKVKTFFLVLVFLNWEQCESQTTNYLSNALSFFGINLNTTSVYDIGLNILEILRSNITTVIPKCVEFEIQSLSNLSQKVVTSCQNCVVSPIYEAYVDINGTWTDIKKSIKLLRESANHTNLMSMMNLGMEEGKYLKEMREYMEDLVNTTLKLRHIPSCINNTAIEVRKAVGIELQKFENCVTKNLNRGSS